MRNNSNQYDVIILGAGASGLLCALTAARRGLKTLILEKSNKVGKKILMSGGGRCNFTNLYVEADNFISNNPHFSKSALHRYTQWDFISMVEQHSIDYEERSHNQLFCQNSAKDILNMLLNECDLAKVIIKTHCDIEHIESLELTGHSDKHQTQDRRSRYIINMKQGHPPSQLSCHSLVIATGALSIPTLGGSGIGYEIAQQFSIPVTKRRAGLVPFMFSDFMKPICQRLSGLALEVEISCNEKLLPNINASSWLLDLKTNHSKSLLKTVIHQKLAKPLIQELQNLWWPNESNTPLAEFPDKKLRQIGEYLNNWSLKPSGTEGYRTAEVTLGGVDTHAISSKTMEAKNQSGLYFVGEVLDVSGHLGGFNFQWAWSSGYVAGLSV
jgi:predicted flavoprotein YhiN